MKERKRGRKREKIEKEKDRKKEKKREKCEKVIDMSHNGRTKNKAVFSVPKW